jgi:hypothetical protein
MGLHSFVELPVATVVEARNLLNETLSPVIKCLVERVLLLAVFVVTCDGYSFHFSLLKVTYFFSFENFATIGVGTWVALCQIGYNAYTAKAETAI